MTSERLGEMFKGDSADTCAGKFPLTSMGGRAEGLACADPGARTPIGTSGNFPARVSAELPSNISPNPSEVISKVSEVYDNFSIFVTPQYVIVRGVGGGSRFFF